MLASLRVEAIPQLDKTLTLRRLGVMPIVGTQRRFGIAPRHWCDELIPQCEGAVYRREPLRGKRDYAEANGSGTRGVFVYYTVESGHLYEVSAPLTWKHTDRYYCIVDDAGRIVRLSEEEARAWLSAHRPPPTNVRSASMS